MEKNKNLFWIVCLITVVGSILWSVTSMLREPNPVFAVFLTVNIAVFIVDVVCFIIDKRKYNNSIVSSKTIKNNEDSDAIES